MEQRDSGKHYFEYEAVRPAAGVVQHDQEHEAQHYRADYVDTITYS